MIISFVLITKTFNQSDANSLKIQADIYAPGVSSSAVAVVGVVLSLSE